MSRAGVRGDREEGDAYYTPPWAVRAFLSAFHPHLGPTDWLRVLEPSCGRGAVLRELVAAGISNERIWGVDIDVEAAIACRSAGFEYVACADYLTIPLARRFDLVIGNPPYSLAEEFIRRSLDLLKDSGRCAFLLRLNFLEGQKRAPWLRQHVPDVYVLPRRPSFYASGPKKGKTDGTAYAWMVWARAPRTTGTVQILDLADCADR